MFMDFRMIAQMYFCLLGLSFAFPIHAQDENKSHTSYCLNDWSAKFLPTTVTEKPRSEQQVSHHRFSALPEANLRLEISDGQTEFITICLPSTHKFTLFKWASETLGRPKQKSPQIADSLQTWSLGCHLKATYYVYADISILDIRDNRLPGKHNEFRLCGTRD